MRVLKEIRSKDGVLHFKRWGILSTKKFSIWLHMFREPDRDEYMHDHPWNFSSLILWGGYVEKYANSPEELKKPKIRTRRFLNFKSYQATTSHQVVRVFGRSYSLIFAGERSREWGYRTPEGVFMTNKEYRDKKHEGLYPKYRCPKCGDWYNMPHKFCKCDQDKLKEK